MTNCSSQKFPSTCQESTVIKTFHNTGEVIRYQEIDLDPNLVDGVVLITENGKYYKAIYTENTINIEWYRCQYASLPTDTHEVMITKAVNTAAHLGAILRFDAREYIVNNQLAFEDKSCFKLLGDKQHTLIKSNKKDQDRLEGFYFSFTRCDNVIIEGLRFDQNKSNLITYNSADDAALKEFNSGIFFTESSNIEITNCHFFDLYNHAVKIYSCREGHIIIHDNLFESGVQEQIYVMEHLVIAQSSYAEVVVENNTFKNAENHNPDHGVVAIYAFSLGEKGSVLVNNNYFEYCGRNHTGLHRLYAVDFYDNVNNFIVSNNIFKNLTWGAIRFDGTRENGIICDNIIHQLIADQDGMIMAASREDVKYNQTKFKNISIHNNILDAATEYSHGITLLGLSSFCAAENIEISNNKMYNLRYGINVNGDVSVLSINNNQAFNLIGIGINIDGFKTGYDHTPLEPKKIEKIFINDNHLNARPETSFNGFVGIQINGLESDSKFMGRVLINDNFISGNSTGAGIVINTGKTLENVVTVTDNTLENLNMGFFIRTKKVFVKDNLIYNATEPIHDADVPGQTIYHENFYNNVII
ncbi:right-handed parallel beta-helix repeat-containing protein [Chryseobacterium sp. 22532]|uniref:right-handed parallel beta-helix repeat-containing protein n=1 Tax=Chryseobacterium sp. 22532 TaxID=3453938 RepID=UPI003F869311